MTDMPGKWKRLLTGSGFIDDLILAPGNGNDTPALAFYLDEYVELGRKLAGPQTSIRTADRTERAGFCAVAQTRSAAGAPWVTAANSPTAFILHAQEGYVTPCRCRYAR